MKTKFLIIFLLYGGIIAKAQMDFVGFKITPFMFISKTETNHPFNYKLDNEVGLYLSCININYRHQFIERLSLNSNLGYLWTNRGSYNGFEITELMQYSLSSKSYLLGGMNLHFNKGETSNQFTSLEKIIPFAVIGVGTKLLKLANIELLYQIPLDSEYKISLWDNYTVRYKLSGMVKLNFGLEWEL